MAWLKLDSFHIAQRALQHFIQLQQRLETAKSLLDLYQSLKLVFMFIHVSKDRNKTLTACNAFIRTIEYIYNTSISFVCAIEVPVINIKEDTDLMTGEFLRKMTVVVIANTIWTYLNPLTRRQQRFRRMTRSYLIHPQGH